MMKFATFENTVELIYKKVIPTPKEECSEPVQLGVSFAGGYIAGISALLSHILQITWSLSSITLKEQLLVM